jgi:predicted transcriptional regulator
MAGLEHARKGEIALLPYHATNIARVRLNLGIARVLEVLRSKRETEGFASEPVALVVLVAVYKRDFNAPGEEAAELGELVPENEVACAIEAWYTVSRSTECGWIEIRTYTDGYGLSCPI